MGFKKTGCKNRWDLEKYHLRRLRRGDIFRAGSEFRQREGIAVKKAGARDLTEGALAPQIVLFTLPLIFSNLLQVMFNMVDVAVVGRFAGSLALGSVGSTATLVSLFTSLLIGMADGINVLTATAFGARDRRAQEETVHSAALISLLMGCIIMVLGWLLARPILMLMNTKSELIDGAVLYMQIYFLGMPAAALFNFGNGVFSAVGNTRRPLMYLSIAGGVNVVLNLVFVIVFHMDVAGVAAASAISQYVSAGLVLRALLKSDADYGLHLARLRIVRGRSKAILGLGIPAGIQYAIFSIANLFIQVGINSFDAVTVAGAAAAANADSLVFNVMAAFCTAAASFVGQNYGAGRKERVRNSHILSMVLGSATGAALGIALLVLGRLFLSLFTADAAVMEAGMLRLQVMCLSYGIAPFMDCSIAASRGLGKSFGPMVIVMLGSCAFRILWVYTIFAWVGTCTSLFMLYPFSWAITAAAELWYFRRVYRAASAHMV